MNPVLENSDIGVIGLGVMGLNLALNIADKGFNVVAYEKNPNLLAIAIETAPSLFCCDDLQTFVHNIKRPRSILLMITAGLAIDEILGHLKPFLLKDDVIIDAGNSNYKDSLRRESLLYKNDIKYIGLGVSGGAKGARYGPAIMAGGDYPSYAKIEPILSSIAARTKSNDICAVHLGTSSGVGHFVKMMHNGIEYADMQIICECYSLLTIGMGLDAEKSSKVFESWSRSELSSFLIEITSLILKYIDQDSKKPLIDLIADNAEQKGTGKLASIAALELGVSAPSIFEAVSARVISSLKSERIKASAIFEKPNIVSTKLNLNILKNALFAAKICSYAQGFAVLRAADDYYKWNMEFFQIAKVWRAGCIIRADFLDDVAEAFVQNPSLSNLIIAPHFSSILKETIPSLRTVVKWSVSRGIPNPVFSASLAYFDSYTSSLLPANLIQAQRDYFGSHGYERLDKQGTFHTDWE
jgi:6-phosphogluconate dehydrogenase